MKLNVDLFFLFINLIRISIIKSEIFITLKQIELVSIALSQVIDKLSDHLYGMNFKVVSIGSDKNMEMLKAKLGHYTRSPLMFQTFSYNNNEIYFIESNFPPQVIISKDYTYTFEYVGHWNTKTSGRNQKEFENKTMINTHRKSVVIFHSFGETYHANRDHRFISLIYHYRTKDIFLLGFKEYFWEDCDSGFLIINMFNTSSLKWKFNNTVMMIQDRFYYCSFYVGVETTLYHSDLLQAIFEKNQTLKLRGTIGEFINIFASKYELKIAAIEQFSRSGMKPHLDISVHSFTSGINSHDLMNHLSFPLIIENHVFLVTRGSKYSTYERMILPFDDWSWFAIVMVFCIGAAMIVLVNLMSEENQDFVYGRNNRDPLLGMTEIFFGLGMIHVPGRNFARYMFMMFTLYCLIIRTAYQGKMFEFMTGDVRKPPVARTNDEVLAKNLTILNRAWQERLLSG